MSSKQQSVKKNTFSNDATSKLLGYDYQKLIALEKCLDAKPNQYIWIECKGDVADNNTTSEIKHHSLRHNITSNSVDVWKTLKNYVSEFHIAKLFDNLILHTTSSINEDSIFFNWCDLPNSEKKQDCLTTNLPTL